MPKNLVAPCTAGRGLGWQLFGRRDWEWLICRWPERETGDELIDFRLVFVVYNFLCSLITFRNNHVLKSSTTAIGLLPRGNCFLLSAAVKLWYELFKLRSAAIELHWVKCTRSLLSITFKVLIRCFEIEIISVYKEIKQCFHGPNGLSNLQLFDWVAYTRQRNWMFAALIITRASVDFGELLLQWRNMAMFLNGRFRCIHSFPISLGLGSYLLISLTPDKWASLGYLWHAPKEKLNIMVYWNHISNILSLFQVTFFQPVFNSLSDFL